MTEPNDKLLDEYLKRESPVSQRYRELEAHDPPPQLDATVLAQARTAVATRSKRRPMWMKWGAPLALAASGVMAVAIVLEIGVQKEVRAPAPQMEQTTSVQSPEARVVEEFSANTVPDVQRDLRALPPRAEVPSQPQPEARDQGAISERARERKAAPEQSVAKAEREQYAQDSAAEEVRVTSAAERSERALSQSRAPNGAVAPAAPPSPTTISERRAIASTAAPVPAPSAAMQQAPRLPADEWLEQIRVLRREGKVLEADEQWREFTKTYPDFVVSETDSARPKQ